MNCIHCTIYGLARKLQHCQILVVFVWFILILPLIKWALWDIGVDTGPIHVKGPGTAVLILNMVRPKCTFFTYKLCKQNNKSMLNHLNFNFVSSRKDTALQTWRQQIVGVIVTRRSEASLTINYFCKTPRNFE